MFNLLLITKKFLDESIGVRSQAIETKRKTESYSRTFDYRYIDFDAFKSYQVHERMALKKTTHLPGRRCYTIVFQYTGSK